MLNNNKQTEQLATDIVNYLDVVNNHIFTDEEKQEGHDTIIYNVNNNCRDTLDYLEEEYNNSNDKDCLELINSLREAMSL